ncbi:MAG: glycosyltransferase family 2 protein [Bacteroidales bacterium]|nr:glycosyltransferase family 2 protein [Bacteroidales bacterium]
MIRYSVVIPHHNNPELLVRCLESIPVREDIEVIVVDDHSPDSGTYLERYPILGRPGLTLIISPENKGGGAARNIGLDRARGQWVVFSDSDDVFVEGAFEAMDKYHGSEAEIVFFPTLIEVEGDWNPGDKLDWLNNLLTFYRETGDDSRLRCFHVVPWSKMIKRELIERLGARFDEIRYSDDVMFSMKTGIGATCVMVADERVYRNYLRRGSVSHPRAWNSNLMALRAEIGMRANKMAKESHSLSYDDAYIALARLFFMDRKTFFKLLSKARESHISLFRVAWKVCHIILRKTGWKGKVS